LTDQAVEGFFEGLVRFVAAIPVGRDFVSRGPSRSLSVASALEVTRSRRARRRRVRARQRERSRRRRALAMTRDVARAFRDTFFRPRTHLGSASEPNRRSVAPRISPPGPPPSLLRSRHMAFPDDPSSASLVSFLPSLRRLESPPAGSPSRTAAARRTSAASPVPRATRSPRRDSASASASSSRCSARSASPPSTSSAVRLRTSSSPVALSLSSSSR